MLEGDNPAPPGPNVSDEDGGGARWYRWWGSILNNHPDNSNAVITWLSPSRRSWASAAEPSARRTSREPPEPLTELFGQQEGSLPEEDAATGTVCPSLTCSCAVLALFLRVSVRVGL